MFKFFKKKSKSQQTENNAEQNQPEITTAEPEQVEQHDTSELNSDITTEVVKDSFPIEAPEQKEATHPPEELDTDASQTPEVIEPIEKTEKKPSIFQRLKQSLSKTRHNLADGIANLFMGKKTIDDELLEELETILLVADIGVDTTQQIIDELTQKISRKQLQDPQAVYEALQQKMLDILTPCEQALNLSPEQSPFMMLMVGVNGAGKTTTIGKIAAQFKQNNKTVVLAAGDTFRAAAVEQLQVWGERNDIPVVAQHTGADSASVIYDALQSTKAKQMDVLIADTAGRLHTRDNLMEELKKIVRVTQKLLPNAPHEVMLVLDATTGQNGLQQARIFHKMIKLDSIAITKLDGTAKGGIIFAIANELKLPIRYIGVGEQINDLRPFQAKEFVQALFSQDTVEKSSKMAKS
tara:strand:- start:14475 stop:15701 length:1227 start_codon:yes stop_codon:yes gene_type:complete